MVGVQGGLSSCRKCVIIEFVLCLGDINGEILGMMIEWNPSRIRWGIVRI